MQMAFEQAGIAVERPEPFAKLKGAIEQALKAEEQKRFLARLQGRKILVRQFETILQQRMLDAYAGEARAEEWYQQLPLSDRGQIREFYLTQIETVGDELRREFHRIFRYA